MKIHFSNVNFSSSSGPNTFGLRLANELVNKGHQYGYQNFKKNQNFEKMFSENLFRNLGMSSPDCLHTGSCTPCSHIDPTSEPKSLLKFGNRFRTKLTADFTHTKSELFSQPDAAILLV